MYFEDSGVDLWIHNPQGSAGENMMPKDETYQDKEVASRDIVPGMVLQAFHLFGIPDV